MVSFIRHAAEDGSCSIECGLEDVNAICNEEKPVPSEWIINRGSDVSGEFIKYALPLVQGQVEVPLGRDGLPVFIYRK